MAKELNTTLLSTMVIRKRGKSGLRTTASEIGTSTATLSRVENGKIPDVSTFLKICRWLKVSPNRFSTETIPNYNSRSAPTGQIKDIVISNLRADETLDPKVMKALVEMIHAAYSYKPANK